MLFSFEKVLFETATDAKGKQLRCCLGVLNINLLNFSFMININDFTAAVPEMLRKETQLQPWEITNNLAAILEELIAALPADYAVENGVAIHASAVIENNVTIKGPAIISADCLIGANAYLRGPVWLGNAVKIGPGSEIKQSIVGENSAVAHLNYIGNSIIGQNVNFEAGSIVANHFNEWEDKNISVLYRGEVIDTKTVKFGALVGDHSKIGANAVLSPGTILEKHSVVKRLELVEQFIKS